MKDAPEVKDALRLAFGTLTILPVRPPSTVDRRTAGRAMVLAPLVGLSLGLVVVAALWALGGGSLLTYPPHGSLTYIAGAHDAAPRISPWSPMVAAVAVVALLALLTRAMHLDGLADVADGLGSGKRGDDALAIMRRSDLGPFGVVTLVLALFFQVMACVQLVQSPLGPRRHRRRAGAQPARAAGPLPERDPRRTSGRARPRGRRVGVPARARPGQWGSACSACSSSSG